METYVNSKKIDIKTNKWLEASDGSIITEFFLQPMQMV